MTVETVFAGLREWFLRSAALREARVAAGGPSTLRARAQNQAQLLVEVGKRVAEPIEPMPGGSAAAAQLSLYGEAVYWALIAMREDEGTVPPDLASAWADAPADVLAQAAGGAEAAAAIRASLVEPDRTRTLEASDEDAARARAFADALVVRLDAPRRRVAWIVVQRRLRLGLVAAALLAAAYGIYARSLGPNLVADRHFRTSSTYAGCSPEGGCDSIFFHTEEGDNPWIEFDLGAPKRVHRVEVKNRPDCCQDRAVPMVIEISTDANHWTEVARRDDEFMTWIAKFPAKTARYVRLKVTRHSTLHLGDVVVR
jgi:hypothetical protein